MTLSAVQSATPISEFYVWCAYFEWETEQTQRLEAYLADLIYHVYEIPGRVFGKLSGRKPEDFIIKFRRGVPPETETPDVEGAAAIKTTTSKSVWGAAIKAASEDGPKNAPRSVTRKTPPTPTAGARVTKGGAKFGGRTATPADPGPVRPPARPKTPPGGK